MSYQVEPLVAERKASPESNEENKRRTICPEVESNRVGSEDRGREKGGPKEVKRFALLKDTYRRDIS